MTGRSDLVMGGGTVPGRWPARTSKRAGRLGLVMAALAVVLISLEVERRRSSRPAPLAPAAASTIRFAGARTVAELTSLLPPARLGGSMAVAIVRDPASAQYYDNPTSLDTIVATWASALVETGATVRIVAPREVATAADARVLVFPASPCLGYHARRALADAQARGRGVIVTWLTGTRSEGCTPVGMDLIMRASGAMRADTLDSRSSAYVTVPAGGPLATDIPPGARLEVLASNHVALRAPERDAYWSDYLLNPAPANGQPLTDGAVGHSEGPGGVRTVYWGFDLRHVVNTQWNRSIALLLLRNSVAWAGGQPLPAVEPWPHGAVAAAVLAQDVEDEFDNARFALDTLRAAGVRGTYFLVSNLARENNDVARALAAGGEVGSHTEDHRLLGGTAPKVQGERLELAQRDMAKLSGSRAAGLRPPEEQFDEATLNAWVRAGGSYVFGANNTRVASPEIFAIGGTRLVLLGRVINDDFASVRHAGRSSTRALAAEYEAGYEKVRALGGLYVLSYHSQLLARPELVGVLGMIARTIASDSATWLATAGEVADWWRRRADIGVRAETRGDTVRVVTQNNGSRGLDGVAVRVALPPGVTATSAVGATLIPGPPGTARLLLPALRARASSTVTLVTRGGHHAA